MEKMKRIKENALNDFYEMIKNSWTYERMTELEKRRLSAALFLDMRTEKALKGSYSQRWEILQAIYATFLNAIGYTDFGWREEEEEEILPF